MKRSRYSEEQIIKILEEGESGRKAGDLVRDDGISEGTCTTGSRPGGWETSRLDLDQLGEQVRRSRAQGTHLKLGLIREMSQAGASSGLSLRQSAQLTMAIT